MTLAFFLHDLVFEFCKKLALEHPLVDLWILLASIIQNVIGDPHVLVGLALFRGGWVGKEGRTVSISSDQEFVHVVVIHFSHSLCASSLLPFPRHVCINLF
jgi:hypothetical protein